MKVRYAALEERERIKYLDVLYTATSGFRSRDDMKSFLRDLLTPGERIMLGRRIIIARMLLAQRSYDDIRGELGVGPDTIRRVHRWLLDQYPGYEKALANLEKEFGKRKGWQVINQDSFVAKLKKKYPLHFLLFPWPRKKTL